MQNGRTLKGAVQYEREGAGTRPFFLPPLSFPADLRADIFPACGGDREGVEALARGRSMAGNLPQTNFVTSRGREGIFAVENHVIKYFLSTVAKIVTARRGGGIRGDRQRALREAQLGRQCRLMTCSTRNRALVFFHLTPFLRLYYIKPNLFGQKKISPFFQYN